MSDLASVQQWVQAVITDPRGVRRDLAVEDVVAASPSLSSQECLAVYARSYHVRLVERLRSAFPGLRHALGDDLFGDFAMHYLQCHPPRGYTVDGVVRGFAGHLSETRPDHDAEPGEREEWPDFVVDLAALETAVFEVYDGPGLEGEVRSGPGDLAGIPDESLIELRPRPAPCLRLLAPRHPVSAYLTAVTSGGTPELPAPAPTFLAVTRRRYRVSLIEVSPREHSLLSKMDGERPIREAFADLPEPPSRAQLRTWLRDWLAKSFLHDLGARPRRNPPVRAPRSGLDA